MLTISTAAPAIARNGPTLNNSGKLSSSNNMPSPKSAFEVVRRSHPTCL